MNEMCLFTGFMNEVTSRFVSNASDQVNKVTGVNPNHKNVRKSRPTMFFLDKCSTS